METSSRYKRTDSVGWLGWDAGGGREEELRWVYC